MVLNKPCHNVGMPGNSFLLQCRRIRPSYQVTSFVTRMCAQGDPLHLPSSYYELGIATGWSCTSLACEHSSAAVMVWLIMVKIILPPLHPWPRHSPFTRLLQLQQHCPESTAMS